MNYLNVTELCLCGRDCDGDSELMESASSCLMKAIIGPGVRYDMLIFMWF